MSLILVSLTVWLETRPAQVSALPNVNVQYAEGITPIEQSLISLIADDLSPDDGSKLSGLRYRLLSLSVPAEAKEFHMSLVFKLQQLEDLLSKNYLASKVSIETLQSDIRTLVTDNQW